MDFRNLCGFGLTWIFENLSYLKQIKKKPTFGGNPCLAAKLFGTTSTIVALFPSRISPRHCPSISRLIA